MKADSPMIMQVGPEPPPFLKKKYLWVDEVFASLSPRERIAQLIHVASWSNRGEDHKDEVLRLIEQFGIGGVIFFQGDPVNQAHFTNQYQAASKVPLMISIDAEWGLAMRLDQAVQFPYQMTLGAIEDDTAIFGMGMELARQCKRLGIHVNFAPSVDINTQPTNPVIGFRSFGANVSRVISHAYAYMHGMQSQGVLAVGKHFPGHGDTAQDSHFTLPTLPHSEERLFDIELAPYRELVPMGLGGVMTGHLRVPVWDERENRGATLSHAITTGILKEKLGFEGLVFTDALDMKGVTNHFPPGEIEVEALLAGNDVLLFTVEVEKSIRGIEEAISQGKISQKEIDQRCKKLLAAKAWAGLDYYQPVNMEGLLEDLNIDYAHQLNQSLARQSIHIPFDFKAKSFAAGHCASLAIHLDKAAHQNEHKHHQLDKQSEGSDGKDGLTPFQKGLRKHKEIPCFSIHLPNQKQDLDKILNQIHSYGKLLVSLHGLEVKARNRFGLTDEQIELMKKVFDHPNAVLIVFGSKYVVDHLKGTENLRTVIDGWQEIDYMETAVAERFFVDA